MRSVLNPYLCMGAGQEPDVYVLDDVPPGATDALVEHKGWYAQVPVNDLLPHYDVRCFCAPDLQLLPNGSLLVKHRRQAIYRKRAQTAEDVDK